MGNIYSYQAQQDQPAEQPAEQPAKQPTEQSTTQPATQPTEQPADQPTEQPATHPTEEPTTQPATQPATPEQPAEYKLDTDIKNIITVIKCINYKSEEKKSGNKNDTCATNQLISLLYVPPPCEFNGLSSKHIKSIKEKNSAMLDVENCINNSQSVELSDNDNIFVKLFNNNKRIYNKYNLKSASLVPKEFVLYMHKLLKQRHLIASSIRGTMDTIRILSNPSFKNKILTAFYYLDWLATGIVNYENSDYYIYADYACKVYERFLLNEYFKIIKNNNTILHDSHYTACIINKCKSGGYLLRDDVNSQDILETLYLSEVIIPSGVIAELTDYINIIPYHGIDLIKLDNGYSRELTGEEIFENYLFNQNIDCGGVNEYEEDKDYKDYKSNMSYRPSNTKYPVRLNYDTYKHMKCRYEIEIL